LLELRRKDLLQRKILRLMHALACHERRIPILRGTGKQFAGRGCRSKPRRAESSETRNTTCYSVDRVECFKMKRILLTILFPVTLLVISSSVAQTPQSNDEKRLLTLIKEAQVQQGQIADNQSKIDAKLADV